MQMNTFKQLVDAVNTDGGHILLATVLLLVGLFCLIHWKLAEGKELFIFALGVLGMAMKSTGKASDGTTTTTTTQEKGNGQPIQ